MSLFKITTLAVMTTLVAAPAFAKAHDQGKADGVQGFLPGQLAGSVDDVVQGRVLPSIVDTEEPGTAIGEVARGAKGGNRTVPTVNK